MAEIFDKRPGFARVTATFTDNNYTFLTGQDVGASEDNYVLTYDHSTGFISLEPPTGGSGGSLPPGGTAGQVLEKIDGTDFNTQWATLATVATSGDYGDLINVPATFTPSAHTHVKADITDFSDGDYAAASHTHTEADITDLGSYIEDAPSDGTSYVRNNGAWVAESESRYTDYLINVEYTGVEASIASGVVLTAEIRGATVYRFIDSTLNANGYPQQDAFYENFDGTNVSNLIVGRG